MSEGSRFLPYARIEQSQVLCGLPIALLEQTLERLRKETNTAAAAWLLQQLQPSAPQSAAGKDA